MTVALYQLRPGELVRGPDGSIRRADSSVTLVETEEMKILVDTGASDPNGLIKALERRGGVDAVVFTHSHHDHVGNAPAIEEAFEPDFYAGERELASLPVDADPVTSFDPPEGIEVIETPGHTPGHVSVVVGGEVVVAGDACPTPDNLLERVPPALAHDREAAERSLEKVLSYPVVIPGHGVHVRER